MIEFTEKLIKRMDVYRFLCNYGNLLDGNVDFKSEITIRHLDGSEFHLINATWDECLDRIYIWTEHCGYFYFYKDDLKEMEVKTNEWNEANNKFELLTHTIMNFHMEVRP